MLGDDEIAQSPESKQPRGIDIITSVNAGLGCEMSATSFERQNHSIFNLIDRLHGRRHMNFFRHETRYETKLLINILVVHLTCRNLLDCQIRVAICNRFDECVVNENVLLLGLHQKVALRANVTKEAKNIQEPFVLDLFQHGVEHNVGSRSTNAGTKKYY